jgi:C1A family cysteine protease
MFFRNLNFLSRYLVNFFLEGVVFMKKLAIVLCIALLVPALYAEEQELQELQALLNSTRAGWWAAENDFSRLPAEEQQKMMGLIPGVFDVDSLPVKTPAVRDVADSRYEAPHTGIKDQRSCGSCYAFGACATYESWKMKQGSTTDLSEQDFMMKAKRIGPYGGCSGWYLDTSMNLLKNNGVTDERCCPYKGYESSCPSSCQPTHKISSWSRTTSLSTIKRSLQSYGLVYVGFAVYSDFSYYSGGVYKYKSGSLRGYHAVAIVGYDDGTQAFKVKNSWGTGWGERGYFRIGYDQMNNSVKFGTCFGGSYYITR